MTLNTMASMYSRTTNQALGFQLKSRQSGRIFIATFKTGNGMYVIAPVGDGKESLVDGDADRYDFADARFDLNAGRRQELSAKLADLINKSGTIEAELDAVNAEIETVELELDGME